MIDPKEIRLGSAVIDSCGVKIIIDEDIMEVIFAARNYSAHSGIPLTRKILTNCGFEKQDYETYGIKVKEPGERKFYTGWFMIHLNLKYDRINSACCTMGDYRNETSAEFKYLHQFQNIYYSLTGKELEVK